MLALVFRKAVERVRHPENRPQKRDAQSNGIVVLAGPPSWTSLHIQVYGTGHREGGGRLGMTRPPTGVSRESPVNRVSARVLGILNSEMAISDRNRGKVGREGQESRGSRKRNVFWHRRNEEFEQLSSPRSGALVASTGRR
jgi:hypothetical protein